MLRNFPPSVPTTALCAAACCSFSGCTQPMPAASNPPHTTAAANPSRPPAAPETRAVHDARMAWWRNARFGMFIHWGLYSIPAGEWNGDTNHAEWVRETAHIPSAEYDKLLTQFNPTKFDAAAWAALAKRAGMKYVVITSKHHDGFCLFDSQYTDFDVMSTPFHRDIMRELSAACANENLRMCWYHSIMDWHDPDYLPRRGWEDRPADTADFNRYNTHLKNQLRELLTNYGPIGILWFDGEWESTWTHERGLDLYRFCREVSPGTIINNRVDKGRSDMAGLNKPGEWAGDYGTPEQEVPATGLPGVDWETCMTMNNHWGFNKSDKDFKSTEELIHTLVDVASKGGNLLLNVGPTAEGLIPPESVERLTEIGAWMDGNGDSIYGTMSSPFRSLPWGRCTQKALPGGITRLYLHVFDWPASGQLVVPGLTNRVKSATLLAPPPNARYAPFQTTRRDFDLLISVPTEAPVPIDTVIVLDISGEPDLAEAPDITTPAAQFVTATTATATSRLHDVALRYTLDGSRPTPESPRVTGPIAIANPCTLSVRAFRAGQPFGPVSKQEFTHATPVPAVAAPAGIQPGLYAAWFEGDFKRTADFASLAPAGEQFVHSLDFTIAPAAEHTGFRFTGFLNVPATDLYRFALTSDDGSRLMIDGREVVNNDGLHVAQTLNATAPLAQGLHAVTVEYFNRTGDRELTLEWARPSQQLTKVPDAAWRGIP